jgi:hypothetical protein
VLGDVSNWCAAQASGYITVSDQRLKTDRGRATDLTGLRQAIVHDFTWRADGRADRGLFAQEAQRLFPSAIVVGTDEMTSEMANAGNLAHPWGVDYTRLVPHLIVGWQDHEARLSALEARQ